MIALLRSSELGNEPVTACYALLSMIDQRGYGSQRESQTLMAHARSARHRRQSRQTPGRSHPHPADRARGGHVDTAAGPTATTVRAPYSTGTRRNPHYGNHPLPDGPIDAPHHAAPFHAAARCTAGGRDNPQRAHGCGDPHKRPRIRGSARVAADGNRHSHRHTRVNATARDHSAAARRDQSPAAARERAVEQQRRQLEHNERAHIHQHHATRRRPR